MTMVLVENNEVTQVGLPSELRSLSVVELKAAGWAPVVGSAMPTDSVNPGYQHTFGAPYTIEAGIVTGSWSVSQRPQPYPSWIWVEGEGWVAPVPYPDDGKDYYWDEEAQAWVLEQLD